MIGHINLCGGRQEMINTTPISRHYEIVETERELDLNLDKADQDQEVSDLTRQALRGDK